jgi:hypothetical protein
MKKPVEKNRTVTSSVINPSVSRSSTTSGSISVLSSAIEDRVSETLIENPYCAVVVMNG